MSQESGQGSGLFSHDTVPIPVYTPADSGEAHHQPVFSRAEDGSGSVVGEAAAPHA
ncbi:hypothetical protein F5X71_06975 [Nocardia brasiliensis]|uniref:Uncharacterized protein n=1 Tax=Nocardia brasiliensis TaxID=37326 RepID=A0A6G9XMG7_NOCBR|nr:hypothetical protein [Nocardia brasiliensis]QIS02096.1 hypothetical protein F5X71_06975 [Nocardia brasiliensis]